VEVLWHGRVRTFMASLLALASNSATGSTPFLRTLCRYAVCAGVPTFSKAAKIKPLGIDAHQDMFTRHGVDATAGVGFIRT
jgi:hypothetical protein